MKRLAAGLMLYILLCLAPLLALAQPTSYNQQFNASSIYSIANSKAERYIGTMDGMDKSFGYKVPPFDGWVVVGKGGSALINYNGKSGTAVGMFGIAEGIGTPGPRSEVVGVYGMAWKSGPYWAAGVHGECILRNGEEDSDGSEDDGGTCIAISAELIGNNQKSTMYGLVVNPRSGAHNVRGIRFENPDAYAWSIDLNGTFLKLAQINDVGFCMKFVAERQTLEFWRKCGDTGATRVGFINMNWGAPDGQLNR